MSLPSFPKFVVHSDEQSAGTRWLKWVDRLENLLTGMNINSAPRKRALLLHYVGDEADDIFDTFTEEQKNGAAVGETRDVYTIVKDSFSAYFTPKKNTSYEIFKFRQAKQEDGETIDTFYTRLRRLATTCDFHDVDREILTQILHGCLSQRLRRRALRDDFSLEQTLAEARSLELSEQRAQEMETGAQARSLLQEGTAYSAFRGNRGRSRFRTNRGISRGQSGPRRGQSQSGPAQFSHANRDSYVQRGRGNGRSNCHYCGGIFSQNHRCPARGKKCRSCGKLNHFAKVCKSTVRFVDQGEVEVEQYHEYETGGVQTTSSDEEFVFTVNRNISKTPKVEASINKTPIQFIVDTGASVNIINSSTYDQLTTKPVLRHSTPKIYSYGAKKPLDVTGYFDCEISYKKKCIPTTVYVIRHSPDVTVCNLMSGETAQMLGLIQFAMASKSVCSHLPEDFPELFTPGLGKIKDVKIKLHIDHDVQPIVQKHRRIPFHVRKDVERELKKLENLDVIEKVTGPTPWVSPIVTVPKKDQGVRICVDMREANKAIKRERHVMPTIDDLIHDLNEATVFSKLDMTQAYHQLELDEESRFITTFSTHKGLFRYKRLIFGVNAAAEVFQNTIAEMLHDIPGAKNLSDDIFVFGKDQQAHDTALHATLQRLHEKGAKLNKSKCIFSVKQLNFYGHTFGEKGISPDPTKIEAIVNMEPPQSAAEVRSFLGMTQYVSRFIPQYATIVEPLRRLTKKNVDWSWGQPEERAFQELKKRLTSTHVLAYFDPSKKTEVIVDASPVGLGAILTQEGKVVTYASRALTETEQRYSQTDREMLGVVYGVEHFHLYLYGATFTVTTDHKPLLGILKSPKPTTARIERWRLRLMPYDMILQYSPGRDTPNPADYMSRHPYSMPQKDNAAEEYVRYISNNAAPKAMTLAEVRAATQEDAMLKRVMTAIQSGRWHDMDLSSFARFKDELSVTDGVVLRDHRLVIPDSLQRRVVNIAHQAHQGIVKTKQLLREKVWFPGIDKQVEEAVASCIPCQSSYPGPNPREPMCPTPLPEAPWTELAIDFAGPFPSGDYILVVIDEYSRFPEAEIIPSTAASVVIPVLRSIFARQGIPSTIKTDNGPPFRGREFADFVSQMGIHHRKITPLWPEANGEAERFMATINKFVRSCTADDCDWKSQFSSFLLQYRATPHSSTKISPFEVLTGRKMNIGLPSVLSPSKPHVPSVPLQSNLPLHDHVSKSRMKAYADKRRNVRDPHLQPGDTVLVKQRRHNKLTPPFNPKPFIVTQKRGSMVTAQGDNKQTTRNASHFRRLGGSFSAAADADADTDESDVDSEDVVTDHRTSQPSLMSQKSTSHPPRSMVHPMSVPSSRHGPQACSSPVSVPVADVPGVSPATSRPVTRMRKPPSYLRDYVLNSVRWP